MHSWWSETQLEENFPSLPYFSGDSLKCNGHKFQKGNKKRNNQWNWNLIEIYWQLLCESEFYLNSYPYLTVLLINLICSDCLKRELYNLNLQYFRLLSLSGADLMRTICFCRVTEQCKLCYMLCYGFSPFPSSPEIFFNSWHTTVRFQVVVFPAVVGAGSLSPPRLQSCSPAT